MMRVLIVDDEEPLRRLLQHWVEAEGASVIEAGTAEEGLALAQSGGARPSRCATSDSRARTACGSRSSCTREFPETVVLMTTGVLEFNAAVNSLQAGVMDYLVKPFSRERLTEALNRAFFAHKARRAVDEMQRELDERRAQITEALGDLEMNAAASLEAMLAMLRVRDAQSYDHAHRVAALAVNLAMALRISEPQLSDIERAALLHNLGRLALPDPMLIRKERTLSEDERAAACVSTARSGDAEERAVSGGGERDRRGRARALRRQRLSARAERRGDPIGARIIAVADVYDELVSGIGDTPVAPAHALEILSVDRIAQFDPMVVGALMMLQLTAASSQRAVSQGPSSGGPSKSVDDRVHPVPRAPTISVDSTCALFRQVHAAQHVSDPLDAGAHRLLTVSSR